MWLRCWLAAAVLLVACEAAPNRGAACTASRDCHAGLVCRFGVCRDECAQNRDCPSGASCLVSEDGLGACSLDVDLGCETGTGRECASGLTCVGDRCVRTCDVAADCPSDGECRAVPGTTYSFCFDPRLPEVDAGPVDAAPSDAGSDAFQPADAGVFTRAQAPERRDVCVGSGFICAIAGPSYEVHCWGDAKYGALGQGPGVACEAITAPDDVVLTPNVVSGMSGPINGIDDIACGAEFACAHAMTGEVWCWGRNELGQLAQSIMLPGCSAVATRVSFGASAPDPDARLFASPQEACLFEVPTGDLRCWGRDQGIVSTTSGPITVPTLAAEPRGARLTLATVAPGPDFACGIATDGELFCWGHAELGQTGPSAAIDRPFGLTAIHAGYQHVVATRAAELLSWGADPFHQLAGVDHASVPSCGSAPCLAAPQSVDATAFEQVLTSAGARFTCALRDDATVECWGENMASQSGGPPGPTTEPGSAVELTPGTPLVSVEQLYVGFENGCARTSAHLYCWGANDHGQLQIPIGTSASREAVMITP
jgi:alpha-tubulin suppressor-like RCC1 family protein